MSVMHAMIASLHSASDQPTAYRAALQTILSTDVSTATTPTYITGLLNTLFTDVSLVISRTIVSDMIHTIHTHVSDADLKAAVYTQVIDVLDPRAVSFEEHISIVREFLAEIHELHRRYAQAARTLMGIKLDSGHRVVTDEYKLKTYIHIVRLLLEAGDDTETAEPYLKRAGAIIGPHHDQTHQRMYKMCQARILDAQCMFLQASQKYFELSADCADDRDVLPKSVVCALLANAGPQRARLLAALFKDDRVQSLAYWPMLEKMHLSRIVSPREVDEFVRTLDAHHLVKSADGSTVLSRAIMQHNLLSASQVYANISFVSLSRLLGVSPDAAERVAANMIGEHRLRGRIDHTEGYVDFQHPSPLQAWDMRVSALCTRVDDLVNAVSSINDASDMVMES